MYFRQGEKHPFITLRQKFFKWLLLHEKRTGKLNQNEFVCELTIKESSNDAKQI